MPRGGCSDPQGFVDGLLLLEWGEMPKEVLNIEAYFLNISWMFAGRTRSVLDLRFHLGNLRQRSVIVIPIPCIASGFPLPRLREDRPRFHEDKLRGNDTIDSIVKYFVRHYANGLGSRRWWYWEYQKIHCATACAD